MVNYTRWNIHYLIVLWIVGGFDEEVVEAALLPVEHHFVVDESVSTVDVKPIAFITWFKQINYHQVPFDFTIQFHVMLLT